MCLLPLRISRRSGETPTAPSTPELKSSDEWLVTKNSYSPLSETVIEPSFLSAAEFIPLAGVLALEIDLTFFLKLVRTVP